MMNWFSSLLMAETYSKKADAGLILLRLGAGGMMMTHGWSKLMTFNENAESFYDFLGLGPAFSLGLTVFAELLCSLLLVLGFWTRLVLIPLIILGAVIAFVIHGSDPFGDKEHGLLFLVPYITLMLTGSGRYSMDYILFKRPV